MRFEGVEVRTPDTTSAPAETKDAQEVFTALQTKFSLHPSVPKYLVQSLKLTSLHDFLYLVSSETEIGDLVSKMGLKDDEAPLQTARLRRAWVSLREASSEGAKVRAETQSDSMTDLDALLPTKDLTKARSAFWARYRVNLPNYVLPSDQLLSRILREFSHKLLSVRPLEKSQTQLSQVQVAPTASTKADVNAYLCHLRTLMVAFAMAGTSPLPDAPKTAETEHTDPCLYVECPLETTLKYYLRAEQRALEILHGKGPGAALLWLRCRDHEDRAAWVETHRGKGGSIGQAIAAITKDREAMWMTDVELRAPAQSASPRGPASRGASAAAAPATAGTQTPLARGVNLVPAASPRGSKPPATFMSTLPGGKEVCWTWNRDPNGCSEPCPHGRLHICGFLIRSNRACGFRNHRFCEHRVQQPGSGHKRKSSRGGTR